MPDVVITRWPTDQPIQTSTKVTEVKNIEPIKFCHWNAPTWGDEGEIRRNELYNIGLIAVATINTAAQMRISDMRYEIARDYANLAQDRWDRFENAYLPRERAFLNEAATEPIYVPDYAAAESNYGYAARYVSRQTGDRYTRIAARYRLCPQEELVNDLSLAEALLYDDGINFGFRYEEYYAQIKNDQRWNRRAALLNLGRDLHAQAATYAATANDMLASLSNLAGEGAQGAISLLGYLSERRHTMYPAMMSGMASTVAGESPTIYSGAQLGTGGNTL